MADSDGKKVVYKFISQPKSYKNVIKISLSDGN